MLVGRHLLREVSFATLSDVSLNCVFTTISIRPLGSRDAFALLIAECDVPDCLAGRAHEIMRSVIAMAHL
jgi:hypothetical protein